MSAKPRLRSVMEAHGIRDISLCLYPLKTLDAVSVQDVFHYHIEKCGGMAVSSALLGATHIDRLLNHRNRDFARGTSSTAGAFSHRKDPGSQAFVTFVGEYNGPRFGTHLLLNESSLPFAFFRDPFDRLVSHYYYDCRRGNIPGEPSPESFAAYFRAPQNTCFQTQMMASSNYTGSNESTLIHEALQNVEKLAIADLHHNMEQALLEIWTFFDLPGIITERLHSNPVKLHDFEDFRDEIKQRNWADYELVNYIAAEPRHMMSFSQQDLDYRKLPQYFGIISDSQSDENALMTGKVCSSTDLIGYIGKAEICSVKGIHQQIV